MEILKWKKTKSQTKRHLQAGDLGIFLVDTSATNPELAPGCWMEFLSTLSSQRVFYPLGASFDSSFNILTHNYQLGAVRLQSEVYPKNTLAIYSQAGNISIQYILPHFLTSPYRYNMNEFLGYVFFVDVSFVDVPERESYPLGHEKEEDKKKIVPSKQGYLGVDEAKYIIQYVKEVDADAPMLVATLHSNEEKAMPLETLHQELFDLGDIKIIPCNPDNQKSVCQTLLELTNVHERIAGANIRAEIARKILLSSQKKEN